MRISRSYYSRCVAKVWRSVCTLIGFDYACLFLGFVDYPLHTMLGIAGVEVSTYTIDNLLIFAVEYSFIGLFFFQIAFQYTDKNACKWNIPILFTFAILDMGVPCKLASR